MAKTRPRVFLYHQKTGGLKTLDLKNCKLADATSEKEKKKKPDPNPLS